MTKPKRKYSSMHSSYYASSSENGREIDQLALAEKRDARERDARTLFTEYKHLFVPTRVFKLVSFLYGERKLFIVIMFHLVATLVIWSHFFLIKFQEMERTVPADAPYYWAKRIIPPLEFGSMHAILFQMTLLPLTMCRYTIGSLSNSKFDRFFPLNKTLRMMQDFCTKFRVEIMQTGYILFFLVIVISSTAFMRHTWISYEAFYLFHALVAALYIISIVHTFDRSHRDGEKTRSQNVKWFAASVLFYVADYATMYINQRFQTEVKSFVAMKGRGGSRMGLLRLRRPTLFRFKPGQYAFLKAPDIDRFWHPFSIASDPNSSEIEFYLEVYDVGSWTRRVWDELIGKEPDERFPMEIIGPYGTGIVNKTEYSQVIAIGSGTGIVPILSAFKDHVHQLLMLNPTSHYNAQHEREVCSMRVERAKESRAKTIFMTFVSAVLHLLHMLRCAKRPTSNDKAPKAERRQSRVKDALRRLSSHIEQDDTPTLSTASQAYTEGNSTIPPKSTSEHGEVATSRKEAKKAIFSATRSIYTRVLLAFLTIYGSLVIGLFLSWTTTSATLYEGMDAALYVLILSLQALFAVLSIFVWKGGTLLANVDFLVSIANPFVDWYFATTGLSPSRRAWETLLLAYMTFRVWWRSISIQTAYGGSLPVLDSLNVVWATRSAKIVSRILPDLTQQWDSLVEQWGEDANRVCQVSIYVTDTNPRALRRLEQIVSNSSLCNHVHFCRPDFAKILEHHSLNLIRDHEYSSSLLTFCGSRHVSAAVEQAKLANDLTVAMAGYKRHHMEFKSESNGSPKTGKYAGNGGPSNENGSTVSVDYQLAADPKSVEGNETRTAMEFP